MRHAEAEYAQGVQDFMRPLSEKGKRIQKEKAKLFKEKSFEIEQIFYSPFLRAKQSAEIIHEEYKNASLQEEAFLGTNFNLHALMECIQKSESKLLLFVGHEPTLMSWIYQVLEKPKPLKLSPSTAVFIEFKKKIDLGFGELMEVF